MKVIFALFTSIIIFCTASADVPAIITYQGRLTDSFGEPVDTTITMQFSICNDSSATICVWGETQPDVVVINGLFTVNLGSVFPISESVFSEENRWLHVKVGYPGGEPIEPPIKLMTSPYAFHVATVDGATGGTVNGNLVVNGILSASPRVYMVENNDQITIDQNTWIDYMATSIIVDKDSSNIFITLDLSGCYENNGAEIAVRAKVGDIYSNPSLIKWNSSNSLQKPHFTFLIKDINAGTYTAGIEFMALSGEITTSFYQQTYAYNRMIITIQ